MPNIAVIHPQVVHFVVALAFVGVGARIASLLPLGPRFSFAGPMGALLIIFSAGASVVAAQSGTDGDGVPGAWHGRLHGFGYPSFSRAGMP